MDITSFHNAARCVCIDKTSFVIKKRWAGDPPAHRGDAFVHWIPKKKKKTCCSDASACLSEWKHACYRSLRRPRNKHFYDAAVLFSIFISHCCKKEVFSMLSHKRKNMISRSAFYGNSVTKQCLSLCGTNNAPLCSLLWSEPCPWKTMKAMGFVAIG